MVKTIKKEKLKKKLEMIEIQNNNKDILFISSDDIYNSVTTLYKNLYNDDQPISFYLATKQFEKYEYINKKQKFMQIKYFNNKLTFIMQNLEKTLWLYMTTYILYIVKKYNIEYFNDIYINYNFNPNNKNPNLKILSCGGNINSCYEISWFMYYILNPEVCGHGNIGVLDIINKYFNKNIWEKTPEKLLIWRGLKNSPLRNKLITFFKELNNNLYDVQESNKNNYIYMLDMYKSKYIIEVTGCSNGHVGRKYFDFLTERVVISTSEDEHIYFFESQYYDCNIIKNIHYLEFNNVEDIYKIIKYLEENPEIYNNIQHNVRLYKHNHLKIDDLNNFTKNLLINNDLKPSIKTEKICDKCKNNLKKVDYNLI